MKKSIVIFLCLLLITGTVAYASSSGMVGKKVVKEVTIQLDEEAIKSKGIIIEGKTYAPLRDVAEAVGVSVKYKGDVVSMNTVTVLPDQDSSPNTVSTKAILERIELNRKYIKSLESHITENIKYFPAYEGSDKHKETLAEIEELIVSNSELLKQVDK